MSGSHPQKLDQISLCDLFKSSGGWGDNRSLLGHRFVIFCYLKMTYHIAFLATHLSHDLFLR